MKVNSAARVGLAALLLSTAACGQTRNPLAAVIGDIPPPDEFQVMTHEPLRMPDSTELPEPRPGAPSPLDANPQRDAMQALLGSSGAPVQTAAEPSSGERVLLSSANAAAASSDIRVQLQQDKVAAEARKPYSPPSLGELLGGKKKEKVNKAELLDPITESQRLQREGVHAPADPYAEAKKAEEERPEPVRPYYPSGRPEQPFETQGTTTAY